MFRSTCRVRPGSAPAEGDVQGCSHLSLYLWGAEQPPSCEGKGCWVPSVTWEREQLCCQHTCHCNTLQTPHPGYLMEPVNQRGPAAPQDAPSPSREHVSVRHWKMDPGRWGSNAALQLPRTKPRGRISPLGHCRHPQIPSLLSSAASWLPFQSQMCHWRAGRGQPWLVALKLTNSVVTCWAKPMGAMP